MGEASPPWRQLRLCLQQDPRAFIATHARVADGYFSRLVGLLGTTRRWAHARERVWIVPSHGVHTIGMLYALDLIFLDRNHVVVDVEEHVRPFRISKVSFKAEQRAGTSCPYGFPNGNTGWRPTGNFAAFALTIRSPLPELIFPF